ncbi:RimJ/RimL family protein N-acetyltransferase [Rudaeicoccus suwonensis]|uniref:RimJ/RimL family protein N-acetyltransferase n=1 Tax=Rudaeicoccus suwonensis TaxID=657409 RepID=A0A561ECK1_9MICO|nr:RimJ/RimL family protein N-acetyltransferase [Rudaeicoccus suwonensis]
MITSVSLKTPDLRTERLHLRPFRESDGEELFSLMTDRDVLRYWDEPAWSNQERATRFIDKCHAMSADDVGVRVVVERLDDGAFLGWCSVSRWNPDFRSAAVGFCFAKPSWGHGYATEVVLAMLDWAFDALDLNRVQAELDTRNLACARVLEKSGFVREGRLRQDCIVDGDVSDSWIYGLIASDRTRFIADC